MKGRLDAIAIAIALSLTAAGCAGSEAPRLLPTPQESGRTGASPNPAAPVAEVWRRADLGPAEGLLPISVGAGPAGILVTAAEEGEDPRLWFSSDGERWHRAALPGWQAGHQHGGVTAVGDRDSGLALAAAMVAESGLLPGLWHSSDGRKWTRLDDDAFSSPGFVNQLRWTDRGFVAVGDLRPGGDEGPLQPAIWFSPDGREWERVVHENQSEGWAADVAEWDGALVALGAFDGRPVAWRSEDGRRWDRNYLPGEYGVVQAAAASTDRLVALGTSNLGFTAWASRDGLRWEVVAEGRAFGRLHEDALAQDEPVDAVTFVDAVVAVARLQLRTDPRWCYVDFATCNQATTELLFSQDGASWEKLALPDDLARPYPEPMIASFQDRLMVAGLAGPQLGVWTIDGLPQRTALEPENVPELPFDIVEWGGILEPEVEYGYALNTHCGIDVLGEFNGKGWVLEGQPPDAPAREVWPTSGETVYGTIRLVASDRIEYSVPDGVIALYAPTAPTKLGACA